MAPAQLAYLLDENDVVEDLRAIERGIGGASTSKSTTGNGSSSNRGANNGISNKRSNYSSPARHSDQSPSRSVNFSNLVTKKTVHLNNCIEFRSPLQNSSYGYSGWNSGENQATFEARVEDGKLFYEKRW